MAYMEFRGLKYTFYRSYRSKTSALDVARRHRKSGFFARVVQGVFGPANQWDVFLRRK